MHRGCALSSTPWSPKESPSVISSKPRCAVPLSIDAVKPPFTRATRLQSGTTTARASRTPPRTSSTASKPSSTLDAGKFWGERAFALDFSDPAKDDLSRLFEFLLLRALTAEEFECVQETIDELRLAIEVQLARAPFNYRTSGSDLPRRELVVPVGATGYVGLALQRRPGTEAGAVVPERHPTSPVQRVRATPSRRAGGPQTQDCLARRHTCRDGATGLYAAPQGFACRNRVSRVRTRNRLSSFNATPAVLAIAPEALFRC